MTKKENLGSILSYRRSINTGIGKWFNVDKDNRTYPLEISSASVVGSVSNHIKESKPDKKDQNITSGNPSRGDRCVLDINAVGFKFDFSVLIAPDSFEPDSNNVVEARNLMGVLSNRFKKAGGYKELAKRYVSSLVSGRVLWRNRIAEDKIMTVVVNHDKDNPITIKIDDTYAYDRLISIEDLEKAHVISGSLSTLVEAYIAGLSGEKAVRLDVSISATYPGGMELYPSQEFIGEDEKRRIEREFGKNYGKVLSSEKVVLQDGTVIRQATTHSQKIGNALRQIDNMREGNDIYGITSIEAYGYSRQHGMALRAGGLKGTDNNPQCRNLGKNLYDILKVSVIEELIEELEKGIVSNDSLYLMASLIRGGVYGSDK